MIEGTKVASGVITHSFIVSERDGSYKKSAVLADAIDYHIEYVVDGNVLIRLGPNRNVNLIYLFQNFGVQPNIIL